MQPSYALLPATSYAIIGLTPIGLKQPLVTCQSQAGEVKYAIPTCKCRKLSQHAVTQSEVREARHAIPACIMQTNYPSMQSPSHRPGKPDILSQYA